MLERYRGVMPGPRPFDPLAEARRQWDANELGESVSMHAAVSIIHAHQVVSTAIDRALRPLDLSFARYEVLMLLSFSRNSALPITKIGERLLVHPTGITRLVDKLEVAGLVARSSHPGDRRSVLVSLTHEGRALSRKASDLLASMRFGTPLSEVDLIQLIALLGKLRASGVIDQT